MGIVMIRCPQTGRDIRTGMTADRNTFDATPVFFARAYCLRHETIDHAVERNTVVKSLFHELLDAGDMPRCQIGPHLDRDPALGGLEDNRIFTARHLPVLYSYPTFRWWLSSRSPDWEIPSSDKRSLPAGFGLAPVPDPTEPLRRSR